MSKDLTFRRACSDDLATIIDMLADDALGAARDRRRSGLQ